MLGQEERHVYPQEGKTNEHMPHPNKHVTRVLERARWVHQCQQAEETDAYSEDRQDIIYKVSLD